ncbi:hypothetical protein SELMODRAFT_425182 [Selaginella moellendorffii]|uniref:PHD-type domain-containing protein n=1 Tax=Selaginella moellendorffii TaxID=88036 RepID=D8SS97_SELML|nr:hypothetical protein SELMODRAFT_425182 [Selaginella moellendorffii]
MTSFSYMGRKTTVDILKFFQAVEKGPSLYSTNRNLDIQFMTGTTGLRCSPSWLLICQRVKKSYRPDSLLQFLKEGKKLQKVYLRASIFDDGNSLDDKDIRSDLLVCVVVFCAFIQSKLRKELIKDTAPPQFIVCGEYTRKELVACIGMYLETTEVYTPTETDTWVLSSHLKDIDSALRVLKSNHYSKKPAEDDDKWISCTYCNVWFHWLCTTATEETWELWLCDNCRAPDDDPDVELPPPVSDAGRRHGTFQRTH